MESSQKLKVEKMFKEVHLYAKEYSKESEDISLKFVDKSLHSANMIMIDIAKHGTNIQIIGKLLSKSKYIYLHSLNDEVVSLYDLIVTYSNNDTESSCFEIVGHSNFMRAIFNNYFDVEVIPNNSRVI